MSTASQSRLLVRRGFAAFFVTQLLSAFNDNFFKNAVMIWISATKARAFGLTPEVMISLCTGVFILPFFLFSATAGELADLRDKARLIRVIKLIEIPVMLVAAGFVMAGHAGCCIFFIIYFIHQPNNYV